MPDCGNYLSGILWTPPIQGLPFDTIADLVILPALAWTRVMLVPAVIIDG